MPRAKEPIREVLVEVPGSKRPQRRYTAVLDVPGASPRRQVRGTFDRRSDAVGFVSAIRAGLVTSAAEFVAKRDGHWREPEPERPPVVTFQHVSGPWLAVKRRTVRPVTATGYAGAVKVWDEALGDKPVADVTRADVEAEEERA